MYIHDLKEPHWQVVEDILHYHKGIINFGITYGQDESATIMGYTDVDWGKHQDDYKSVTSHVFKSIGGPITWASKKKNTISLSSIYVETKAITKVGPIT
jgi:hypothetical protein